MSDGAFTTARLPGASAIHFRPVTMERRRVRVALILVSLAFLALFLWFDAPLLAWLNLGSIALYAAAYALLARRINLPALALIWTEVLGQLPPLALVRERLRAAALTVPEVADAVPTITAFENRRLSGYVEVTLTNGTTSTITF